MGDFDRLCEWHGIAPDFLNYGGEHIQVSEENRRLLLAALGYNAGEEAQTDVEALFVGPWQRWLPPLSISRDHGAGHGFSIRLPRSDLSETFQWLISAEDVVVEQGDFAPAHSASTGSYHYRDESYEEFRIPLPVLEPGYYDLLLLGKQRRCESRLAVVPEHAYNPGWVESGERLWGTIIQLYTLRSERDWGIGDFADLRYLIIKLAGSGADVVGLNPLHALLPHIGHSCSPYSPSDRRFISPLYISVEDIAEYNLLSEDERNRAREQIAALRQADSIDYEAIKDLKYGFFEKTFSLFAAQHLGKNTDRDRAFSVFMDELGDSLQLFSLYELARNFWANAHEDYCAEIDEAQLVEAKQDRAVLKGLLSQYRTGVLFHCYLQWLCHSQLRLCQHEALNRGMKIGLLRDLAVGADGSGAEVTMNADLYCRGAAVGAPPDPLAERGQNWGLPPLKSPELTRSGYAHYIDLLRTNMADCGALRIDHAMSLMRLWWCPPGKTADFGAYVYYAFDDLLSLLVLESHLNKCVVVAEDLGVVPGEFRQALTENKIFTNKMFYFERNHNGSFKVPFHYDAHALAMVNNHDVPTLVSWWNKTDLVLRYDLGLLEEGTVIEQVLAGRDHDKQMLAERLREEDLFPDSWHGRDLNSPADEAMVSAILALVARASSQIYVMQLEDLLLMDTPVNLPGTSDQYPNWRRKLSQPLETMFASAQACALLQRLDRERKPS